MGQTNKKKNETKKTRKKTGPTEAAHAQAAFIKITALKYALSKLHSTADPKTCNSQKKTEIRGQNKK